MLLYKWKRLVCAKRGRKVIKPLPARVHIIKFSQCSRCLAAVLILNCVSYHSTEQLLCAHAGYGLRKKKKKSCWNIASIKRRDKCGLRSFFSDQFVLVESSTCYYRREGIESECNRRSPHAFRKQGIQSITDERDFTHKAVKLTSGAPSPSRRRERWRTAINADL